MNYYNNEKKLIIKIESDYFTKEAISKSKLKTLNITININQTKNKELKNNEK